MLIAHTISPLKLSNSTKLSQHFSSVFKDEQGPLLIPLCGGVRAKMECGWVLAVVDVNLVVVARCGTRVLDISKNLENKKGKKLIVFNKDVS